MAVTTGTAGQVGAGARCPRSSGCRARPLQRAAQRRRAQPGPLDELGVGEDLGGRAVRDDSAVRHHDHAVGVLGDELHVVRDDEDRRPLVD